MSVPKWLGLSDAAAGEVLLAVMAGASRGDLTVDTALIAAKAATGCDLLAAIWAADQLTADGLAAKVETAGQTLLVLTSDGRTAFAALQSG